MSALLALLRIMPSWCYWLLILVGLCGLCEMHGAGRVQKKWDMQVQQQKVAEKAIAAAQEVVLRQVVTQYVDRVQIINNQAKVQIKEVPVYVPIQADAVCSINAGFVRLWNAANAGATITPDPGGADAAPSGISLSDTAAQHIREAIYTRQLEEQLIGLQDAVRAIWAVSAGVVEQ